MRSRAVNASEKDRNRWTGLPYLSGHPRDCEEQCDDGLDWERYHARYQRQLDLHRKDADENCSCNNRGAWLKVARYCRPPGGTVLLICTTRSICASMLAGRARVIAEMHNWERIWKAWLRSTMSPIVEINRDAGGSWQSASVRNSHQDLRPLDVNVKIMQQCPLQYWLQRIKELLQLIKCL